MNFPRKLSGPKIIEGEIQTSAAPRLPVLKIGPVEELLGADTSSLPEKILRWVSLLISRKIYSQRARATRARWPRVPAV